MNQVFPWFPGSIIVRVALPFDKVLETVATGAVVQNLLDNILCGLVNRDWGRWWWRESSVWKGGWVMVGTKEGYKEDRVDAQGIWKFQLVCYSRDLLDDPVRANEPMLEFLGGA